MKILHINCADYGSTGKIISEISKTAYDKGCQSYLLVPDYKEEGDFICKKKVCFPHETGVYRRISNVTGLRYGFAPVSTRKIISEIKKIVPDIVHIHSANCNMVNLYTLFSFLKKNGYPTVITNHAEFFYTGTCSHSEECLKWQTGCGNCPDIRERAQSLLFDRTHCAWEKMKSSLSGFDRIAMVSVSPWVHNRACLSPITDGVEKRVILNGVNTEIFKPATGGRIREKHSIADDEKILLCVSARFDPKAEDDIKGSRYVVEIAEKLSKEKIRVLVVGRCVSDKNGLPSNLTVVGNISDQYELAEYYNAADLSIITSKRETFSMIVAESLCCGTPIIGFKAGGPESISIDTYSWYFEQGDVDGICRAIISDKINFKNSQNVNEISAEAMKKYSGSLMAREYLSLYEELTV